MNHRVIPKSVKMKNIFEILSFEWRRIKKRRKTCKLIDPLKINVSTFILSSLKIYNILGFFHILTLIALSKE